MNSLVTRWMSSLYSGINRRERSPGLFSPVTSDTISMGLWLSILLGALTPEVLLRVSLGCCRHAAFSETHGALYINPWLHLRCQQEIVYGSNLPSTALPGSWVLYGVMAPPTGRMCPPLAFFGFIFVVLFLYSMCPLTPQRLCFLAFLLHSYSKTDYNQTKSPPHPLLLGSKILLLMGKSRVDTRLMWWLCPWTLPCMVIQAAWRYQQGLPSLALALRLWKPSLDPKCPSHSLKGLLHS